MGTSEERHTTWTIDEFDVMVMENMFGDILSDQAGGILGSLGLPNPLTTI